MQVAYRYSLLLLLLLLLQVQAICRLVVRRSARMAAALLVSVLRLQVRCRLPDVWPRELVVCTSPRWHHTVLLLLLLPRIDWQQGLEVWLLSLRRKITRPRF
jgi:hypothetical protein